MTPRAPARVVASGQRIGLALRACILTPSSTGIVHHDDGALLVDDAGRIVFVGPWREGRRRHAGPFRDLRPLVVVPGFVDAHVHYPQTRIIGRATGRLLDWLERTVFPEEARFERAAYARAVADEFAARLLAAGTTSAAIYATSSARATDVLFERLAHHGLRALVGLVLMDRSGPRELLVRRERAMAGARSLVRRWHGHDGGRLEFAVTPRFAPSCTRALLRDAGRLAAEHGLPVQTHIAETHDEGRAALAAHPYATGYADIYDRAGLLGERTVLAHCIHLRPREWGTVRDRGASVAHCPDSNFFLGSGRMRLDETTKRGIPVGLGTDVGAGRSFSMRRIMASAYDNALCLDRPVDPAALLRLATLGGAEALGWDRRVGSLEPGKEADLVALGLPSGDREGLLAALVFDSDETRVARVWIRGKELELGGP
jgi:guanine deaminase